MHYLEAEGSEGTELLPLLKSKLGSALRSEVQSVRYRAPYLVAMVAETKEPIELAQGGPGAMRPVSIRSIALDDSDLKVHGHFGFTEALINTCTEVDIAVDLGLMWLADTETVSLRKEVESLKDRLESSQEINTLLIDLAKTLAEEKGDQLQEQIIEKTSATLLNESVASQLSASTDDDVADLLDSPVGGVVEDDIYCEIYEQIKQLHVVERLALWLCEPDRVLEDWVENQYGEFLIPTSCTDIKLSCDTLIDQMARAVEGRIHEAVES
jgi:hypothetical protein